MRIGFEVVGRGAGRRTCVAVVLGAVAALGGLAACGGGSAGASSDEASRTNGAAAEKVAATVPARSSAERGRVLFVGTSLTAGLGLDPSEAYPALIAGKIDSAGLPFEVVNAGVSGETSSGALRRIDWLLREPVDAVVLETGANDGLRGVPVAQLRRNIRAIIERVQAARPEARVLLVQMEALPNFGPEYTGTFRSVYPEVARETGVTLVPFLLEGVAGVPALNQPDGIHPTAEGARLVAATIWESLGPVLAERAGSLDAAAPIQ
jgi:acyl-CoA thioesterase I